MSRQADIEFVSELDAAVASRVPGGARVLLFTCIAVVVWALVWASGAELDEVARGTGKVVPFSKVQVVGHVEGGVVEQLLVRVGDRVEREQVLMKVANTRAQSSYQENAVRLGDLKIRLARLTAENTGQPFLVDAAAERAHPEMAAAERDLYRSNLEVRDNLLSVYDSQLEQRQQEIVEMHAREKNARAAIQSIERELEMRKALVAQRLEPEVNLLRLEREMSTIRDRLDAARETVPRLERVMVELKRRRDDVRMSHQARTRRDLADTTLEINQLEKLQVGLAEQMARALVRSPIRGVVKQLFVNTLGGVVKAGMDLAEIVPVDDNLLVEVRVRPADIGFIRAGQPAMVKVSAFEFSIYGGFPGRVESVGADSHTDERAGPYFLVWIRTDRNYLGTPAKPLRAIAGMTVTADIVTGKKTVMQYLLNPILKARQDALRER